MAGGPLHPGTAPAARPTAGRPRPRAADDARPPLPGGPCRARSPAGRAAPRHAAAPQLAGASSFRCAACLEPADAWQGYCPACRRWDTLRAETELAAERATREPAAATSPG